MWNPVTITALISAGGAAIVAIIGALRSNKNATAAKNISNSTYKLIKTHIDGVSGVTEKASDDFAKRVNPN